MFAEISDAAIEVHRKYGAQLPTGHSTMHLYPIDGAASRVPADATAFPYRDGGWAGVIVGVDPDPANAEAISQWTRDYWSELHPTSAGGAYVNFLMDEGEDRVRASYRRQLRPARPGQAPLRPGEHCSTSTRTSSPRARSTGGAPSAAADGAHTCRIQMFGSW